MKPPPARTIHSRAGFSQIPVLLQALFSAELLVPSRRLWLVSPWISDIPILDNTAAGFSMLGPLWGRSWVRL